MKVKKISLSHKAQKVKYTLYGEDSNFLPMVKWLEKGNPSSRGHSPCRAHIVGCRTQDAVGLYLSFCSGAFLFRGKSVQPYSKTQPMAAIILIRILIIIFLGGGIISLGRSPHLSYPHRSEGREDFLASES